MNFDDKIRTTLKDLRHKDPSIRGSALVSDDGLALISMLPPELEADRVAGMNSVMMNIGINSSEDLNLGNVKQLMIHGEDGYLIVSSVIEGAMLLVVAEKEAKLGAVFFFMKQAIKELQKAL